MQLLVLTAAQATSADAGPYLTPRPIVGGPEAGNYAVSVNVLTDSMQEPYWPLLNQGHKIDLDTDAAWPPNDTDE